MEASWLERRLDSRSVSWLVAILLGLAGALVVNLVVGWGLPLLGFLVPIALIVPLLVIQRIELGLLALVVASYVGLPKVLSAEFGIGSTNLLLVAGLIVALLVRAVLYDELPQGVTGALALVLPFLFACLLSAADAVYLQAARDGIIDLAKAVTLCLLVVALVRTGSHLRLAVWAALGSALFLSGLTTYQHLSGELENNFFGFAVVDAPPGARISDLRISGPLGDPNFYALILVALVPLAFERLVNGQSWIGRTVAGATLVCCSLSIFFTYSRGGVLGLAVVLLLLVVRWRPKLWVLAVATPVLVASLWLAPNSYQERMGSIPRAAAELFRPGAVENSLARGRVSEWLVALQMLRDHPVLGVGVGNYPPRYLDYSIELGLDSRLEDRSTHSLYLEVASETGLVGFVAFTLLLGSVLWRLRRSTRKLDELGAPQHGDLTWALLVSLAGFLACSVFLHNSFPNYMWLLLGLGLSAARLASMSPDPEASEGWVGGEKGALDLALR